MSEGISPITSVSTNTLTLPAVGLYSQHLLVPGYTKLFESIVHSTIWREPDHVRLVWITMLALARKDGIVDASLPGLADVARVSVADCEKALATLQQPDAYSRSKEADGRRILPVDGGWLLVNHGKYRAKLNEDERREYFRVKQAEYRQGKREAKASLSTLVNTVKDMSRGVNTVSNKSTQYTQAEAEAEAEAVRTKNQASPDAPARADATRRRPRPTITKPLLPPDPRVKVFLQWFAAEYTRRRAGADYLVKWAKHGALVKQMLGATALDTLQIYAQIMLSEKCEDPFILESDRGIEVLSAKFNWLSDRYAAWKLRRPEGHT